MRSVSKKNKNKSGGKAAALQKKTMDSTITFLVDTWLAVLCLLSALACALAAVRKRWDWRFYLPALLLSAYGVGALDFLPDWTGPTFALTAFGSLILMLVLVLRNGFWDARLGHAVAGLLFSAWGRLRDRRPRRV